MSTTVDGATELVGCAAIYLIYRTARAFYVISLYPSRPLKGLGIQFEMFMTSQTLHDKKTMRAYTCWWVFTMLLQCLHLDVYVCL